MRTNKYKVEVCNSGDRCWKLNGEVHREDGPAVINSASRQWWTDGELHRENGPAVEWESGERWWYLEGEYLSKEEYLNRSIDG